MRLFALFGIVVVDVQFIAFAPLHGLAEPAGLIGALVIWRTYVKLGPFEWPLGRLTHMAVGYLAPDFRPANAGMALDPVRSAGQWLRAWITRPRPGQGKAGHVVFQELHD